MKDQQSYLSDFVQLIQQFQVAARSTRLGITRVFQARPYGRIIEIKSNLSRKKLHRTNQGSNFLEGCFSNRDNVRDPIQFRRERQPQYLKRSFFLKNRPIHSHINSTSVITLVKRNQMSFSSIEINKPFPAPVHSISYTRFKFSKPVLVVTTDQMPDHILSRKQYHQHRQQYYITLPRMSLICSRKGEEIQH